MNLTVPCCEEKIIPVIPDRGETLLSLLRHRGNLVPAPCGGKGTCGKCKVQVVKGNAGPYHPREDRFLSSAEKENGLRLSCLVVPPEPLEIVLPSSSARGVGKGAWERDFSLSAEEKAPWIEKQLVFFSENSLEDQRSLLLKAAEQAGDAEIPLSIGLLKKIQKAVADSHAGSGEPVTLVSSFEKGAGPGRKQLISLEPGDTTERMFGCAVDIGTTTVAVYLADLYSGLPVDSESHTNLQGSFGADVISRIGYAMENGTENLSDIIVNQLNDMIGSLVKRNGISADEIYRMVIVANTTMLHFLLRQDPSGIASAPFVPVFTEEMVLPASDVGLKINTAGRIHIAPGISSYVGADITSGILSSGLADSGKDSLLVDIGTNGEIALKTDHTFVVCSTAAGPAFEGAKIRCGIGGEDGAVDSAAFARESGSGEEAFHYTTIGSRPAVGICGSGLVDLIAVLLRMEVIDETGRMADPNDLPPEIPGPLRSRMTTVDGKPAFIIVPSEETLGKDDIVLTQQDVREVQLAKAAIAAGIDTLMESAGVKPETVDRFYLAGGFGSYVRKESAVEIGLIPWKLRDKVEVVGNAAGIGALFTLLSRTKGERLQDIASRSRYIELSSSAAFQDHYIGHMLFERLIK